MAGPQTEKASKKDVLATSLAKGAKDPKQNLPFDDTTLVIGLTALASVVRLWNINYPDSVVFDEVHFGGFASKYIKGEYFMDVHPPLAKMLIALVAWLAGFDGEFDFKDIGKDYIAPGVPYVAIRLLPAILGILVVPLIFLTLRATGATQTSALLGAMLVIFDNGLVTQSRLILLDSPLVICTAFTAYTWTVFESKYHSAAVLPTTPVGKTEEIQDGVFSADWWTWLALTGLGLGATVSMKWVGLFTIAWVGSLTLLQLWNLLGDLRVTPNTFVRHFLARAFCLVVIPIAFYMAMFAIHFVCLVNPGDGDGFMSSEFQQTLNFKRSDDTFADVAYGSRVTIRHLNTKGGYLHSHAHMYPGGSNQQQVTLYPHRDDNNIWTLTNQTDPEIPYNSSAPIWIENGALIRLEHIITEKRLHSHDVRPPISEVDWQNEVSAYGFPGFEGDANDYFRVEIVKDYTPKGVARERLRAIDTKFRLVHYITGCALFSHKVKLPEWGFGQQEVTCARSGTLPNSLWYIESNTHPTIPADAEKVNYRVLGFFAKFWELNKVMWVTNADLTESHTWDSRPNEWPWLRRGINFWGKDHRQIYLIGNPAVWWPATLAVAAYLVIKAFAILRWQRGYKDSNNATWRHYDWVVGVPVLGWFFHYFPFYLMKRQLFLHHYLPALYFSIIALCQSWDYLTTRGRFQAAPRRAAQITLVFLVVVVAVFAALNPLAYGGRWTKDLCQKARVFSTWDFDCGTFYPDYASYNKKSLSDVGKGAMETGSSGVVPVDSPQPVHYQEGEEPKAEHTKPGEAKSPVPTLKPSAQAGQVQFQEVVYRDEFGNILDEEALAALIAEQGDNIEFKTVYETKTKTLQPGEEPPPGAKRIIAGEDQGSLPIYPAGQNPDTGGDDGGEKKAYPT